MENNISNKVENLLKTNSKDDALINSYIEASKEFEKLVQEGLTSKRGFNLMTTEEIYNPTLNCSYSQTEQNIHS